MTNTFHGLWPRPWNSMAYITNDAGAHNPKLVKKENCFYQKIHNLVMQQGFTSLDSWFVVEFAKSWPVWDIQIKIVAKLDFQFHNRCRDNNLVNH